jgi:K+ transporter
MNPLHLSTIPLHTLGMIAVPLLLLIVLILWLLPLLIILFSNKTSGTEKLAWVLAVIFISWFAWVFYLLLAPIKKN